MATEVSPSPEISHLSQSSVDGTTTAPRQTHKNINNRRQPPPIPKVLTTIYSFPTLEPLRFAHYPSNHLHLPLRRDILHRAVIYEGDMTRQGTASTKWRDDIHGSNRKIRPQKGTGRARLGNKKSPMLRGGGAAFGPHPRDFSTGLPRKIYDLAWRTALSHRYRRGELIICEDGIDLEEGEPRWAKLVLGELGWGNAGGRTLVVTEGMGEENRNLWDALGGREGNEDGRVKTVADVDVKDLLEMGRVCIERSALDTILQNHQSDLNRTVPSAIRY